MFGGEAVGEENWRTVFGGFAFVARYKDVRFSVGSRAVVGGGKIIRGRGVAEFLYISGTFVCKFWF